jgi:hypothetical protein
MNPDYDALYAEITHDDKYAGMSDEEIAESINTEMVTSDVVPCEVNGGRVFNAIDLLEFRALDALDATSVRDMWTAGAAGIDIALGTIARQVLECFSPGSITHANLVDLTTLTQTLAQSMGFVEVTEHEIAAARQMHEGTA